MNSAGLTGTVVFEAFVFALARPLNKAVVPLAYSEPDVLARGGIAAV